MATYPNSRKIPVKNLRVRRDKIYAALVWLRQNHFAYAHVIINYDNLQDIPENAFLGEDQLKCVVLNVKVDKENP